MTEILRPNNKYLTETIAIAAIIFLGARLGNAAEPVVVPSVQNQAGVAPALVGKVPPGGFVRQPSRFSQQHILVKLSPNGAKTEFFERARRLGLHKLKNLADTDWYTMSLPANVDPREMAATARGLPGIVSAVADPILSINDMIPPTDPFYVDDPDPGTDCDIVEDPNCSAEDLVDQWGLFQVEAELGWATTTGSSEVVIAVLDSGIDQDHDDLWDNIWTNAAEMAGIDGVDDDGNGKIDDKRGYDFAGNNVGSPYDDQASEDPNPDIFSLPSHQWIADPSAIPFGYRFDGDAAVGDGIDNNLEYYYTYGFFTMDIGVFHGTAVAGIAAMMANNINPDTGTGEGMAGACWNCKIMNVRTINAEGEALGADMVEAIYYAVDNGANIINASWGIPPGGATSAELAPLEEAIRYAVDHGVVFIAAAGNGGGAGLYFPASMPETIAVGSSNWLDARSDFSTYAQGSEVLDVVAPGELIWTSGVMSAYDAWVANYWLLFPELWDEPWRPGDDVYNGGDGTSFATPLVSGYAGLILSRNPCATPDDVRQIIRDNAVDVGSPGYDAQTGYGRMRMVVPDLGCTGTDAPPSVTVSDPQEGSPVYGVAVAVTAVADDDSVVAQVEFLVDGWSIGTDSIGSDGWTASWDSTAFSDGTHTITATATDDAQQSASDSITVLVDNVNEPPTASFTYDCTDLSCTFDAAGSVDPDPTGTINGYDWDFGDGENPATGVSTDHQYTVSGTYTVTLTVVDNGGLESSVSQTLDVVDPPPADLPPDNVTAINNDDGTATISWSYGGIATLHIEREKEHAKRAGVWQSRTEVWSGTGEVSYIDASGTGSFRYRVGSENADGTISWSLVWAEVTVTDNSGGSGSTLESEKGRKKCSDGIDNDGDGLIDAADPDC